MLSKQIICGSAKYIPASSHKLRRIANQIRGSSYKDALLLLEFLPYTITEPVWNLLYSTAADAKKVYGIDKKTLYISHIIVDEGPKLKRIRARAKGRGANIKKPMSHITISLKSFK
mmetsp:Transcript_12203/g.28268  ORF Transcript_12203/g.28268 Transcript_12203/m.28268 type:complete len:116 (-) Transcript_12203:48-395(-)